MQLIGVLAKQTPTIDLLLKYAAKGLSLVTPTFPPSEKTFSLSMWLKMTAADIRTSTNAAAVASTTESAKRGNMMAAVLL